MNQTPKAGVVIIRDGTQEPEILLVFRGVRNDWSFPKGHCEAGESFEQTALRETKEETGLDVRVIKQLPNLEYQTPNGEDVVVVMYLGTPLDANQKEKLEYEADQLEWVPVSAVEERLSYQNLKDYFRENKKDILSY
jgi:ADP-ribose pyrophosphatase YjhB (NUDIX family)